MGEILSAELQVVLSKLPSNQQKAIQEILLRQKFLKVQKNLKGYMEELSWKNTRKMRRNEK